MFAMRLHQPGTPLRGETVPDPHPSAGEIRVKVLACGVCRTDLHVVDGDLAHPHLPVIPGHEIVGEIDAIGSEVVDLHIGQRVGIPWLGHTCGNCTYCRQDEENLCDHPIFTGYTRDGGYATLVVADAHFAFPLSTKADPVSQAPLLCAGLIGWRSLKKAGQAQKIGLYGFGAAAHIIAQVLVWQKKQVYAFTRQGDTQTQDFARSLGANWAGGSNDTPPEALDAAIIFAPVGTLVPIALKALRKGGRVVCAGIHMSQIPAFPYDILWEEREIVSVANLTREDGLEFLALAGQINIHTTTHSYPLAKANQALDDLRHGRFDGAAVLVP
ncbi:zinc-dependent alcohol dehydrogenase family protein [Snodgrassella sp. CFCC 13594]|uniref:zinc-dependent alcohol dehydrogenase family protein n=1 Tax=Snodgrassella sp. CFCC 13594 TaxID=1775559 RepID=UPI000830A577|nr:zinc-dependent alcohol dehydrogenase family protein [Snodgrassella sp. CFCC 13594]